MVHGKTYLSSKFSGIYIVFLSILNSETYGIFWWSKIAILCKLVPIPPFPKYIGLKIQDPKETSWIQGVGSKIQNPKKNCLNPGG